MALLQYGSGVAKMSGRVAGQVYAHNKGGAYVRRFSVPTNPSSQRQQDQRTIFGNASAAWRNLTNIQMDAWKAWAQTHPVINRLGAAIILSGQGAYVQINSNYATYEPLATPGSLPPPDPVFHQPVESIGTFSAAVTGPAMTFSLGASMAAGDTVVMYASPPISPGRNVAPDKMRLLRPHVLSSGEITAGVLDVTTLYQIVWGDFSGSVGSKIIAQWYPYSNGQIGVFQQDSAIVT